MVAFRRAAELGAAMIELDVQLTRDDAVVVLHDDTLERTTDGTGRLADHMLADVERLDAGSWFDRAFAGERVPTLTDVLDGISLPINVELKAAARPGLAHHTLAEVERAGALERVVFSSFDGDLLVQVRSDSHAAVLAVLVGGTVGTAELRLAERVSARALHVRKDAVTPAALAVSARAGLLVRCWTVNEPEEFARLSSANVDAVFTDFPERFLHPPRAGQGRQKTR